MYLGYDFHSAEIYESLLLLRSIAAQVKSARQLLALKAAESNKPKTKFDTQLKGILAAGKPIKEDKE